MRLLRVLAVVLLSAAPSFAAGPLLAPATTTAPSTAPVPAIPEPAALALFVLGVGVVGVAIRRRKA